MFTKEWIAVHDSIEVKVVNKWNMEETTEELYINGELKVQKYKNFKDINNFSELKELKSSRIKLEHNGYRIEAIIGSAWHMMGVACKILVDGEQVGGNRIVLFAGKNEED